MLKKVNNEEVKENKDQENVQMETQTDLKYKIHDRMLKPRA